MKMINFKNNHFLYVLLVVFISTILSSCNKIEFDKIAEGKWDPNMAVPLAFGDFGVYDILARIDSSDVVIIDPNQGNISLVYKGELFEILANEVLDVPDFTENRSFDFSEFNIPPQPSFNGSASAQYNESVGTPLPADVELNELSFLSGNLNISVETNIRHDLSIQISIPELSINSIPFNELINFNGGGSTGTLQGQIAVNLSNYLFQFPVNGNNEFNLEAEVDLNGSGDEISGNEFVNISVNLENLSINNAIGFFGNFNVNIQDSILLRIFNNMNTGTFQFLNPKFRLNIANSFGIPVDLNLNELKTIVVQTGQELLLSGFPGNNPINSPNTIGNTENTTIEFNNSNTSNIESIVTPVPRYLFFEGGIEMNPNGPPALNFLSHQSVLTASGEVELPLDGFAYGFEVRDTFEFNGVSDLDDVQFLKLRMIVDNGFPVDIKSQVLFVDDNYNLLFSAFNAPEDVVVSGQINADGRVVSPTQKITDIVLNNTQINLLSDVKHLIVMAYGETKDGTNGERVVIFDDYKIKLQLGMQVEANLTANN